LNVEVSFFYEGLQRSQDTGQSTEDDGIIRRFLATSEGYSLSRAFCRIDNPHTRSRLLELVRTIADSEGSADTGASRLG
ncbi:MAG: transcriptional regulator, partial [Pseudomonadota bacterium]